MRNAAFKVSPIAHRLPQVDEELVSFAKEYFAGGAMRVAPPRHNVIKVDTLIGIVLYRSGQFQVEMILFEPNAEVPQHVHPHIDSIEVAFSGSLELFVQGVQSTFPQLSTHPDGMARDLLRWVPIPRDSWHGGRILEVPTIFLSVQRWHGMVPSHVVLDWRGKALGLEHAALLSEMRQ